MNLETKLRLRARRQRPDNPRFETHKSRVRIAALVSLETFDEIQRMAIRRKVSVSGMIAEWLVDKAEEDRPK